MILILLAMLHAFKILPVKKLAAVRDLKLKILFVGSHGHSPRKELNQPDSIFLGPYTGGVDSPAVTTVAGPSISHIPLYSLGLFRQHGTNITRRMRTWRPY